MVLKHAEGGEPLDLSNPPTEGSTADLPKGGITGIQVPKRWADETVSPEACTGFRYAYPRWHQLRVTGVKMMSKEEARTEVLLAVLEEMDYQDKNWGDGWGHGVGGWCLILAHRVGKIAEAMFAEDWPQAKQEVLTVAAVAVTALIEHGLGKRRDPTPDATHEG